MTYEVYGVIIRWYTSVVKQIRSRTIPRMRRFAAFRKRIARNIREARRAAGLSQEKLVELAGFNARWYQDIEAGKSDIRLSTLFRIAQAIGLEPEDLLKKPNRKSKK